MSNPHKAANVRCAQEALSILRAADPTMKLGAVYEILARLAGFKSWNVASAMGADLTGALAKLRARASGGAT